MVDGVVIPKVYASYDRGLATPIGHSSVWLRTAVGYSPHDRAQPFANFYFGGFGNNYVDHGDAKRYRQYSSFPGVDLNAIGGRSFVKSTLEWNLPPWRFSRAGTPAFYAAWLHPTVFVGGLVTNMGEPSVRQSLANIGTQIDVRLAMLSELEMTLSVGGAIAVDRHGSPQREAMISLKILR
jgi:hypothetical protein